MEALLQSLITKYGFEYAAKLLGLDQQTQNPKYAISMGGQTLDVGNMAKKGMLNQGIKALTGASKIGMAVPLIAGSLGLAYLRNPLRPGSMNYMPGLQQELNFAADKGYITQDPGSGLAKYGGNSVLSGQNAVSMFGTNSYIGQLEKKADYFKDRIAKGKNISTKNYAKTLDEIAAAKGFTTEKNKDKGYGPYSGGSGGVQSGFTAPSKQGQSPKGSNSGNGGSKSGGSKSGGHSGSGYQGASGSHHFRKGGIASL